MKPDPASLSQGGVVHVYQKYDPQRFPSPTEPPPDLVSPAFEHWLRFGGQRPLTPEELARAIRLDVSQIAGLGPSLESLLAMLRERKARILATYETRRVTRDAARKVGDAASKVRPPQRFRDLFEQAVRQQQLYQLERLWYAAGDDGSPFARQLLQLMEAMGAKYEIDEMAGRYEFHGQERLSIPQAIEIGEELAEIDRLIEQLEQAKKDAQIGIIDMEALSEYADSEAMEQLQKMRQQLDDYLREEARRQGLEREGKGFTLSPEAYRMFQGRLLERIFSQLQASRSGRHANDVSGEGAVEMPSTKEYEFGDSLANLDLPQSLLNAMIRQGSERPLRLRSEDLEVHRTRNRPKAATVVIMDMSGSMRYAEQYVNVKRMALALEGLIRREYPGDFLRFIQMYTFARLCPAGEIIDLLPQPVTVHDPVVRLKADLSKSDGVESMVPPHFTNIQQSLQMARRLLATQDTPNRQVVLITDGLPTAHCEDQWLYMLYPPDPRTEQATLREGLLCARDGITINLFVIPSWSQSEEDIRFAQRLAGSTKGRVFFTAGKDLDRFVVWDYVQRKREVLG